MVATYINYQPVINFHKRFTVSVYYMFEKNNSLRVNVWGPWSLIDVFSEGIFVMAIMAHGKGGSFKYNELGHFSMKK